MHGWRPDIVVLSSYDTAYGYGLAVPRDIPNVFIYHSSFHSEAVLQLGRRTDALRLLARPARAFVHHVEARVLRSAWRVVGVSPFSKREIATYLGADTEDRCVVIETGVDTVLFKRGDRGAARERLGIAADALVLITVGRLAPVKRYDRAIAATAVLRQAGLAVILLIVGDGPERSRLGGLASALGVTEHVRFEGYQDGNMLVERFRSADIQLCTSDFENWSLALLEGLACGLPVLGTPFGSTPDLLSKVDPALVMASAKPEDIAAAISNLASNSPRMLALGDRARAVAERYDWEHVATRFDDFLRSVAEGQSAKRSEAVQ
jgi:D-inositol-3-phosphate glycosyltransferase